MIRPAAAKELARIILAPHTAPHPPTDMMTDLVGTLIVLHVEQDELRAEDERLEPQLERGPA